jgi:hypothetical protein
MLSMLWELIATVIAGIGAAGIALFIRKLAKNKAPAYLIPVFAGTAMLAFQIYSEYSWYPHQASRLPEGVVVVKTVEEQAVWRPWSYLQPQILRFIAADVANMSANSHNAELKLVDLYFFSRRSQARRVTQVVHCGQHARADFTEQLDLPLDNTPLSAAWQTLSPADPLMLVVCQS